MGIDTSNVHLFTVLQHSLTSCLAERQQCVYICRDMEKEQTVCAVHRGISIDVGGREKSRDRSKSFAPRVSRKEMAMKANMRAFRSTYLDIGLGHIGRLRRLAREQAETSEKELTNPLTRILLEPVWATGAG